MDGLNIDLLIDFFQFGSLLDENSGSKFDNVGLNAMANRDKAGTIKRHRAHTPS